MNILNWVELKETCFSSRGFGNSVSDSDFDALASGCTTLSNLTVCSPLATENTGKNENEALQPAVNLINPHGKHGVLLILPSVKTPKVLFYTLFTHILCMNKI